MSELWVNFIRSGDPNGGSAPHWPTYKSSVSGLNLVIQDQEQGGSYVEQDTYRLAGIRYLTENAHYRHV